MKNKKSLGQNWLKNRTILDSIADLAATDGVPTCLEIGPGLGTLTSSLLKRFDRVIAVEFDDILAANLPKSFPGKSDQLTVIHADILDFDFTTIPRPFVIAGNIPYYITSPIIKKCLAGLEGSSDAASVATPVAPAAATLVTTAVPAKIVLLVQREVADRIAAEDGRQSLLSLMVQNLATVILGPVVPAREFTPPPQVDSRVIVMTPRPRPQIDPAIISSLARVGFASPRKKLLANLVAGTEHSRNDWLATFQVAHIHPDVRAERLTLSDWQRLSDNEMYVDTLPE